MASSRGLVSSMLRLNGTSNIAQASNAAVTSGHIPFDSGADPTNRTTASAVGAPCTPRQPTRRRARLSARTVPFGRPVPDEQLQGNRAVTNHARDVWSAGRARENRVMSGDSLYALFSLVTVVTGSRLSW